MIHLPGKAAWSIGAALLLVVAGVSGIWRRQRQAPQQPLPVRVATVSAIVEAPVHVAYQQQYFEQEGLRVSLEVNPDGKTSLENLFAGKVDIAAVMGTPVVYESFQRDDFTIVAKMDHSKIHFVVARKDRGIATPSDIRGKTVASMKGTSGEFFMDSWLISHGLMPSDVMVRDMNAPAMVEALVSGKVDAMFCWFPFPMQAAQRLGDNAVFLPSENFVPGSWVIVTMKAYARERPEILAKFLRGLVHAEQFINEHREEALAIHANVSGVKQEILATIFKDMRFHLKLDHPLLLDLEDQARWIIRYGYTDHTDVPNFLEFLSPEALRAVRPDAVKIITGE